jgi:hypothetical protein
MNKDLDDRLIPNGEYRDAQNISVGKSEDDDIGALETVLGNTEKIFTITPALPNDIQTIGYLTDEYTSKIFVFATNYTDINPNVTPTYAPTGKRCIIYSWSPSNPATAEVIVDGIFLNFSTTNPIEASLIENLLFFTDNRNQPRKVNINEGVGYYTDEVQMSVAKYNPYTPISLLKRVQTTVTGNSSNPLDSTDTTTFATTASPNIQGDQLTMGRSDAWNAYGAGAIKIQFLDGTTVATDGVSDAFLNAAPGTTTIPPVGQTVQTYQANINVTIPTNTQFKFVAPINLAQVIVTDATGIEVGMQVVSTSSSGSPYKIAPNQFIFVTAVSGTTITLSANATVVNGDIFTFMISTMTNKSSVATWPGDPDYLEGRYVRFSYRYRFDDGEYSIFAPFTQIAFVPKQKGYFKSGDEDEAFRSTVVAWMENNVNNIEFLISLPDSGSTLQTTYKILSLDILYKESDQTVVKVLETIPVSGAKSLITDSVNNIYTYEYQSRKPYKTLPSDQTTRVYDKVPVRALAQETAGNRIIYGNFRNAYSAPDVINYGVSVINKSFVTGSTSWIEYPNHSLKQNRNYQVGFVLADKFGRQSPVILSPITSSSTDSGSTIFSPYNSGFENMKSWFGDTLQVSVTQAISSGTNSLPNFDTGQPGLYVIPTNVDGFAIKQTPIATITDTEYNFTLDTNYTANNTVPIENDYLRGQYVDYVKVNAPVTNDGGTPPRYTVSTDGRVNSSYLNNTTLAGVFPNGSADLNFAYALNPVGWYSYKVVVKQTEQDYYNAYLPGILSGYPDQTGAPPPFPSDPSGSTANIVLINDNINKIPRDLSEVGPDQKQFRSSVQVFGRVSNNTAVTNVQYFPGIDTDTAISISTADDSNMSFDTLGVNGKLNLYQIDTNPLVSRLATNKNNIIGDSTATMRPFLAIYETEPQESLLDIFWETSTVGLISDLNADVATGYDGPTSFTATSFELLESDASGHYITDPFFPVSSEGTQFNATYPTTATMTYTSPRGHVNKFILEQDSTLKSYKIKTVGNFVYLDDSITQDVYTFAITVTVDSGSALAPGEINTITINGALTNVPPSFVNNPLPDIVATVDQLILPGQNISAVNGSSYSGTEKIQQLKWAIQATGNPIGLDGQPSFEILDNTVGQLTQRANNTPNGQHAITLEIADANRDTTDGALIATATQNIFIGPEPANDSIKSTCVTGPVDASTGIPNSNALITNFNGVNITGVWYLSATALTAGYTSGTVNSDIPITPSTATSISNTLFRLGSSAGSRALTQGQLVLSLNTGMIWANTPPPSGLQGGVSWKVWHRSNSSSAWAHISDINNQSVSVPAIPVVINTANTGSFDNFYNQIVVAFDQTGEYCIAAIDAESSTAGQQSQALTCWVNSNDLNYSTCVIEDGTNITGGTARASYEYGMSTNPGAGYNCSYGTTPAWSNVPYGQYVPQFFSSSTLSTPYTFPDAGGGISGYLAFKTQGSSPFDDPSSYRYSFSTRFSTADGKVYIPNPWSQCYIENCGNTAAPTATCNVLQMEFPY